MKHRLIYMIICLIFLTGCAHGPTETVPTTQPMVTEQTAAPTELPETEPPQTEPIAVLDFEAGAHLLKFTDESTGDYLDYYLFVPENAVEDMPLLVFLHGDGEVGHPERLEHYGPMIKAKEIYGEDFPFLALYPCTRSYSWTSGYIPRTLKALIDTTVESYRIDSDRIIITGHSRGSVGVWYMISAYGDYFSAAIPISCGPFAALDLDACDNVPVWAFAGSGDQLENRYSTTMKWAVDQIVEYGGTAQLQILKNVTHANTCVEAFSEDVFTWMLEQ